MILDNSKGGVIVKYPDLQDISDDDIDESLLREQSFNPLDLLPEDVRRNIIRAKVENGRLYYDVFIIL